MKTAELASWQSESLDKALGTVLDRVAELQSSDLFSKGRRGRTGGLDLTETDVVNLMLALELKAPRGEQVSDLVRSVRGRFHDEMPVVWPAQFTRGLKCFESVTAGEMLDNALLDMRDGSFDRWADGQAYDFSVSIFHNGASVFASLNRGDSRAVQGFAKRGWTANRRRVERQTTLDHRWFREIAEKLGPLPPI